MAATKKKTKYDAPSALIFERRPMQFPVRLTVEEHNMFRDLSRRMNRSMSHLVRVAILELLVKELMITPAEMNKILSYEKTLPSRYVEPELEG